MQTSVFLAKLIGPVMLVVGVSLLIQLPAFRDMASEFVRAPALIFLSGLLLLPVGIAIVLHHNVWVAGWPIIITVLGWLAVIGGTVRLLALQRAAKIGNALYAYPNFAIAGGALWAVIGALLCFFGYFR